MPTAKDFQESECPQLKEVQESECPQQESECPQDFQESECPQPRIFRNLNAQNAHSQGFSGI